VRIKTKELKKLFDGTVLVIGTLDELRERASLGKDASLEEVYTVLAS
jgi:hypothetical protein